MNRYWLRHRQGITPLIASLMAEVRSGFSRGPEYLPDMILHPPIDGPYLSDKPKKISFIEDKLRRRFEKYFPERSMNVTMHLMPERADWYTHPADEWVERQMSEIQNGATEQEAWDICAKDYFHKWELAKLQRKVQQRQAKEIGVLALDAAKELERKHQEAMDGPITQRVQEDLRERKGEILALCNERILESQLTETEVQKITPEDVEGMLTFAELRMFMNEYPELEHCFDNRCVWEHPQLKEAMVDAAMDIGPRWLDGDAAMAAGGPVITEDEIAIVEDDGAAITEELESAAQEEEERGEEDGEEDAAASGITENEDGEELFDLDSIPSYHPFEDNDYVDHGGREVVETIPVSRDAQFERYTRDLRAGSKFLHARREFEDHFSLSIFLKDWEKAELPGKYRLVARMAAVYGDRGVGNLERKSTVTLRAAVNAELERIRKREEDRKAAAASRKKLSMYNDQHEDDDELHEELSSGDDANVDGEIECTDDDFDYDYFDPDVENAHEEMERANRASRLLSETQGRASPAMRAYLRRTRAELILAIDELHKVMNGDFSHLAIGNTSDFEQNDVVFKVSKKPNQRYEMMKAKDEVQRSVTEYQKALLLNFEDARPPVPDLDSHIAMNEEVDDFVEEEASMVYDPQSWIDSIGNEADVERFRELSAKYEDATLEQWRMFEEKQKKLEARKPQWEKGLEEMLLAPPDEIEHEDIMRYLEKHGSVIEKDFGLPGLRAEAVGPSYEELDGVDEDFVDELLSRVDDEDEAE